MITILNFGGIIMRNKDLFNVLDMLTFILVKNGIVIEVNQQFTHITGYHARDLLDSSVEEVFRILKVCPDFDIGKINEKADYFLFTKSLEVRSVNIKIVKETDKEIYIISEKPNSRFEDNHIYLSQLCESNIVGVAVYSVPDMILVKANQKYLSFLEPPFNQENSSIGRKIEKIIKGWKGSSVEKFWHEAICTGKPVQVNEYEHKGYERGITYWDSIITPIPEEGRIKYVVSNTYEVTEKVLNRKKIQEQVEEISIKNKQLEAIIESVSDGMFLFNKDNSVTFLNDESKNFVYNTLEYKKIGDSCKYTQYFGKNGEVLTLSDLPGARAMNGERIKDFFLTAKRPDRTFYYSISASPMYDSKGNIVSALLCSHDITELINSQNKALEQKKQLETIIQNMDDAIFIYDSNKNYYMINEAAKQYFSSTEFNKFGDTYDNYKYYDFNGNEIPLENMTISKVFNGEVIINDRVTLKNSKTTKHISVNGRPIYDDNGNIKFAVISSRDITQDVKSQRMIEKQKKLLEDVVYNLQESLYVYDKDGKYIIRNRKAIQFQPNKHNTLDQSYSITKRYKLDETEIPIEETATYRIKCGKTTKNDIVYSEMNGNVYYSLVNGAPVFDKNGELLYGIISTLDITDLVKSNQLLDQTHKKLLQSEQEKNAELEKAIEMKDEFLSLISHEFRTPLNVINAAIQAMDYICGNELSDKARNYLGMIRMNTFRQLRLVNNLLDITRANAGRIKINKKNIDIVFLTKAITESVYHYASQKGVRVTFASSFRKKIIGIDDEKYERIILNLLSNAIKFTSEGKAIVVNLRSVKGSICVEVKDNGIGIPPNKIDIIFERFGQVDSSLSRQAEGAGIGLSLVKNFVEALGGYISVKSKVGKGSTFTILLPNETIAEEHDEKEMSDLLDNRLIQTTNIEFSDIYL